MKNETSLFPQFCRTMGLPEPVAEHRFHPERRWRFDYCWPEAKIALEVEGGGWVGGRHTSGKGFQADMVKYNAAACLGWRVLRVEPRALLTVATAQMIKEARCA